MAPTERENHNCSSCRSATNGRSGRTPTQGSQAVSGSYQSGLQASSSGTPNTVYVVTDTCYPTKTDFSDGKGMTAVFSVHSTIEAANAKAKKIIYENEGGCTVDIDKVIEETRRGLYTGIGVGGQEERADHCYARKCEVESKMVDEDSEDESGESNESGIGDERLDGDVEMG